MTTTALEPTTTWALNHLDKLAKWLSCVVSIDLYDAFDCMFFSRVNPHSIVA